MIGFSKSTLTVAISSLLGGLFVGLSSVTAYAISPFTVKDIRVEGVQRTEAGTVFSYLPVKVGEREIGRAHV